MKFMAHYHQTASLAAILLLLTIVSCARTDSTHMASAQMLPKDRQVLAAQMKELSGEHVHMPPIPLGYAPDRYLNMSGSELKEALKGKVVLVDIFDYTCVNCIRTLPYIKAWNEKYKNLGLVILGVHSPEFDFEKHPGNLDSAVKRFGLTNPIIADNDFEIWNSLANHYWPAKYLFDAKGILRTEHFGEGDYQSFESFLQKILLERDSTIKLPDLTAVVREADKPGAVCYRPTPELYIGYNRSHFGNDPGVTGSGTYEFVLPKKLAEDVLYLAGRWEMKGEFARPAPGSLTTITVNYQAKEVNLVIRSDENKEILIEALQDGKPIPPGDRGQDIVEREGRTYLLAQLPRMYSIVSNSAFGRKTLELRSSDPAFVAYAFTFTTDCKN